MPDTTPTTPAWPFGDLGPGSYRMWSSGDGWGDAVITEGGRLLVRQLDRDGTYGDDWHDMTSIYRSDIEWEFERVAPHPSMPIPAEARARIAELEAQLDRVRAVHQPIEALNMRHHPRGQLAYVCSGCGTDDGNWQVYPCPTIRALDLPGDIPARPRTPKETR